MNEKPETQPEEEEITATEEVSDTEEVSATEEITQEDAPVDQSSASESEAESLKAQITDLEDRLKRAYAEQQNQRQRMLKEKAANDRYAGSKLATDLLEVIDNLERAVHSVPVALADNSHVQNLITGVKMVNEQFLQVFATHGIQRLKPIGEHINYEHHETIAEVDDNPAAVNTVIDVVQAGYLMNDRLLRPAKVVISSGRMTDGEEGGKPVDEEI